MNYYSLDIETDDPELTTRGPSWIWNKGRIICVGLYSVKRQKVKTYPGDGGEDIKKLLMSDNVTLIGANIAYDIAWLCYAHGIKDGAIRANLIDIQVAEAFIHPYANYSLEVLAQRYLNEHKGSNILPALCIEKGYKGDFRKYLGKLWDDGYEDEILRYVASDADQPARIWGEQEPLLIGEGNWDGFQANMRMMKVTIKMKVRGVRIDKNKWKSNCAYAAEIHDKLERNFFEKYGQVNIQSPAQLGVFFKRNKVPFPIRLTVRGLATPNGSTFNLKKHGFSQTEVERHLRILREKFRGIANEKGKIRLTLPAEYADRTIKQIQDFGYNVIANPHLDKTFLQENKGRYPVIADLIEYKQVRGIISKFLGEKFGRFLSFHEDTGDWRIHCDFNVVGARQTRRMSSSKTNLQNIPSKTTLFQGTPQQVDLAALCREVFIPEPGHVWVKLDFHSQENVVLAHFASGEGGKLIRKKYRENPKLDEHQFVADRSGLESQYDHATARKLAKNARFGIQYGAGPKTLSALFGWSMEFAQEMIDTVKDAAPWMSDTMDKVQEVVRQRGYIKLIDGSKIYYRDFNKIRDKSLMKTYPYTNYLIQGSSSCITKNAQIAISESESCDKLLLSVHDEGDHSLPMTEEGLYRLKELIHHMTKSTPQLTVPLTAEPDIGRDWAHLESQREDETLDDFWWRMCKTVDNNDEVMIREYDDYYMEDVDDEDDEESI